MKTNARLIENVMKYYRINEEEARTMIEKHSPAYRNNSAAALYVGTYCKYNSGNLFGMWCDISTFDNYDDLVSFFHAIHSDEKHPELMYQDYEGIPRSLYCEFRFSEDNYHKTIAYIEACVDYDEEFVSAMFNDYGCASLEDIQDKVIYAGNLQDYAHELLEDQYDIDELPELIRNNIDYEGIAIQLKTEGYTEVGGYVIINR